MNPAAIILAAGESRRMGRPKAFLPFRDGTFLSVISQTLSQHCSPVIAVFGFDAAGLMPQATAAGAVGVENSDYRLGMLTSLQKGLASLPQNVEIALFTLVDHPAISATTITALLLSKATIAIPRFEGKRGHPVLIRRPIIDEFLNEPRSSKVRDVIDRHAHEIHYIPVDDPGISDDVDDPAIYEKLLAREAAVR